MAPKRAAKSSAPPPPPPPPAESSEETDSRSRSEESEDEETTAVSLTPVPKKNPPAPAHNSEESETSDEEEEEEEEEPARAAPPSAPKNPPPPPPRQGEESDTSDEEEEEGESESDEQEGESDEEAPPTKPAPEQKAEEMKPLSSGEAKKPAMPYRRGWSPDDEVRILEALAAHRRQHGKLPRGDALVAALAGSLDNRAAGSKEVMSKVRCLRERYVKDAKKTEVPSKEHDRLRFDLSKIVWGGDKALPPATTPTPVPAPTPTPVPAPATRENVHAPREFGDMCEMYPYIAEEVKQLDVVHPGLFKRPFGRIDSDKACKLDLKIKKQRVAQVRVEQRRSDLAKEVIKTLLELIQ